MSLAHGLKQRVSVRPDLNYEVFMIPVRYTDDGNDNLIQYSTRIFGTLLEIPLGSDELDAVLAHAAKIVGRYPPVAQPLGLTGSDYQGPFIRENGLLVLLGPDQPPKGETLMLFEAESENEAYKVLCTSMGVNGFMCQY